MDKRNWIMNVGRKTQICTHISHNCLKNMEYLLMTKVLNNPNCLEKSKLCITVFG